MNNPDLNEILNKEIGDLADLMKTAIQLIGDQYNLNVDQTSEIERDFIARLAFAAIKYGDKKEEEEDCENCSAKDYCSFKEPEKEPDKKIVPDEVWKALSFTHNYCKEHDDCDGCMFSDEHLSCKIKYTPNEWEVRT